MRAFVALLLDAFYESVDQKVFTLLLGFAGLLLLGVASLRFTPRPPEEVVQALVEDLHLRRLRAGRRRHLGPDPAARAAAVTAGETLRFRLRFGNLAAWRRLKRRVAAGRSDAEAVVRLLRGRGARGVVVRPDPQGGFRVEIPRRALLYLPGAYRLSLLFGLVTIPAPVSAGLVLVGIAAALIGGVAGFLGVAVALVATAGFVPRFLQRGRVDFILSRPVSRALLVVGRYAGGLTFVGLLGGFLILGLWIILGFHSGHWSPLPLLALPCLLYFFGVLYAVSLFMGVLTRSTLAALLTTFLFWGFLTGVHGAYQVLIQAREELQVPAVPPAVGQVLTVLHRVLPRTDVLDGLSDYCVARAYLPVDLLRAQLPELLRTGEYPGALATTAAFVAGVLFLAWLRLRRRDF